MLNKRINTMWVIGIMLAFVVALGASNALANTFANYTLSNINLSGFIGPYATVQVDLNVAGTRCPFRKSLASLLPGQNWPLRSS